MKNSSSLFKQGTIGVFWMVGSQVVRQLIHTTIRLVLASLLVPADFGLMAMAMLIINFTNWFLDIGFGPALVQRKELTEAHRSTAFWANLFMGIAVFGCLILAAPLIASFFQTDALTPLIVALSFGVLFISPRSTLENLLMREGKFKMIGSRQIWAVTCGGIVGLTMAWLGYGVWALVAGSLIDDLIDTSLLFWRSAWHPRFLFHRPAFIELWQYSKPLLGARLFNYCSRNLDTVLIGRFLGATPLGYYNLGYQFVLMPLLYITRPVNKVLLATLSQVQDDPARLRKGYLQSVELLAFVTFPIMALFAVAVPDLLPALLGEKWRPAGAIIPMLCFVGAMQSIQNVMPSVFQATNKNHLVFRWTFITILANAIAFPVGLFWGIQGVVIAYASAALFVSPFLQNMLLTAIKLPWAAFGWALFKPLAATAMMLLAWITFGQVYLLLQHEINIILRVSLQSLATAAVYLLASWTWNPQFRKVLTQLNGMVRTKQRQQPVSAS